MSRMNSIYSSSTTTGLTSAYQLTEITGAGVGADGNTGGLVQVRGTVLPSYYPVKVFELVEHDTPDEGRDPALADFIGPLGKPLSHQEMASRLEGAYTLIEHDEGVSEFPDGIA